jgi:hypothetical protein
MVHKNGLIMFQKFPFQGLKKYQNLDICDTNIPLAGNPARGTKASRHDKLPVKAAQMAAQQSGPRTLTRSALNLWVSDVTFRA